MLKNEMIMDTFKINVKFNTKKKLTQLDLILKDNHLAQKKGKYSKSRLIVRTCNPSNLKSKLS